MVSFVNAKINLGLRVIRRLPTGYHQLETIFYPVGLYNGTPECELPFCDVLEIVASDSYTLSVSNWDENIPVENNIVHKAYILFREACSALGHEVSSYAFYLQKHLPSQAGMGGGSADGTFALRILNELSGSPLNENTMWNLAKRLGADCPFFLVNRPALGEGIGDRLTELGERLKGYWCALVKPDVNMPTSRAFSLITPSGASNTLRDIYDSDVSTWRGALVNDFERPFFELYPGCSTIKDVFYESGAVYTSLTGSGATFYALFKEREMAEESLRRQLTPYRALVRL